MLALKLFLSVAGAVMLAVAVGIPLYGLWLAWQYARRKSAGDETAVEPEPIAWRGPAALGVAACLPLLVAGSIVVVPSGMGGVRISHRSGFRRRADRRGVRRGRCPAPDACLRRRAPPG